MERRKVQHFLKGRQSRCSRRIIPITVHSSVSPKFIPNLCNNLDIIPQQYKRTRTVSIEKIIKTRSSGHIQTKFDQNAEDEESKFKELLGFL